MSEKKHHFICRVKNRAFTDCDEYSAAPIE